MLPEKFPDDFLGEMWYSFEVHSIGILDIRVPKLRNDTHVSSEDSETGIDHSNPGLI